MHSENRKLDGSIRAGHWVTGIADRFTIGSEGGSERYPPSAGGLAIRLHQLAARRRAPIPRRAERAICRPISRLVRSKPENSTPGTRPHGEDDDERGSGRASHGRAIQPGEADTWLRDRARKIVWTRLNTRQDHDFVPSVNGMIEQTQREYSGRFLFELPARLVPRLEAAAVGQSRDQARPSEARRTASVPAQTLCEVFGPNTATARSLIFVGSGIVVLAIAGGGGTVTRR